MLWYLIMLLLIMILHRHDPDQQVNGRNIFYIPSSTFSIFTLLDPFTRIADASKCFDFTQLAASAEDSK